MRLAILGSLAGHAVALAALAAIDWQAPEGTPAIPVAVLIPPALGDQASAPQPSTAAPPPPPPAASAPASAGGAPSFDLALALADLARPIDLQPPKPAPAPAPPKPTRQASKPAPAPRSQPAGEQATTEPAAPAPAQGTDIAAAQPATAPVVERGPSVLPGNPRPIYPPVARRRELQGRAVVRATVTAEGQVASVELRQSSSHESLDRAALEAVRAWRFVPARRGEQAVAGAVDVPVVFRLED